jgi:hypothetical protein
MERVKSIVGLNLPVVSKITSATLRTIAAALTGADCSFYVE